MSATTPAKARLMNERVRNYMDEAISRYSLEEPEPDIPPPTTARKRAFRDPRAGSRLASVSLVEAADDGVLRWVYDPPPVASSGRRRRRRASSLGSSADEKVLHGFQFREVPPNQITEKLTQLDSSLTPERGLRQWKDGKPGAVDAAAAKGKVLLLIHGTFSKGDMYFEEFAATVEGRGFLAKCEAKYDAILTFDHPTLSMSPWINALDLTRAMADFKGPIDVICHSRGGLVASWWLFHARPPVKRVVFAGSPLEGTSLAAPAKVKKTLDLLGNFARALGAAGDAAATAVPMLAIAGGLMKIVGGFLSVGARTPILDAGIGLVPGLAAQSRVASNFELERLLTADWMSRYELHALVSDFAPVSATEPWWKFWTHFRDTPGKFANWGADAIFEGANDLVVDTASMTRLGDFAIPDKRQLIFAQEEAVHHCAYFRQAKTMREVGGWLGI